MIGTPARGYSGNESKGLNQDSNIWRSALSLAAVAVIGTAMLSGVNSLTAKRIAEQERRVVLQQLGQVMSPERYDNPLQNDRIEFRDEQHFPRQQIVTAYRARKNGEPVAVILKFAAVKGYNGNIDLLAGINLDGTLSGVRVSSHKETPGLGDFIETGKCEWVMSFDGRSLKNPDVSGWTVKRDGGEFDQFTGATITPRAVVEAVRRALNYYQANRQELFDEEPLNTGERDQ